MGLALNLTPYTVGEAIARDGDGRSAFIVAIKATYSFAPQGRPAGELVVPKLLARDFGPQALVEEDRYRADPATSSLAWASDLGQAKPAVDVWLAGEMRFPVPITEVVVGLEVGARIAKRARVFGPRHWLPGMMHDLVPSPPKPMTSLPLAWELACGGASTKPATAGAQPAIERLNPVGCSVAAAPAELEAKPAPRYEDPEAPVTTARSRNAPWGFGPIAPHWEPRAGLAGTYDERWQEERAPLLPADFQPAFFNVAPADQRLPFYAAGEEVRLTYMTAGGRARFVLPALEVPVLFVSRNEMLETVARVDTIVIEPAEERLSLVARAVYVPEPNPLAMRQVFVGELTKGRRLSLERGKAYVGPDMPPSLGVPR